MLGILRGCGELLQLLQLERFVLTTGNQKEDFLDPMFLKIAPYTALLGYLSTIASYKNHPGTVGPALFSL